MTSDESPRHLDVALSNLALALESASRIDNALLIEDSVGRISIGAWAESLEGLDQAILHRAGGAFYSGSIFLASEDSSTILDLDNAWAASSEIVLNGRILSKVRRIVRFRTLTGWQYQQTTLWDLEGNPAIVTFYSYKGGLGRTTSLVSFAIQRARLGERVVILDLDLEAPGLDLLARHCEPAPRYGIVDFLLEAPQLEAEPDLSEYSSTVANPELVGEGGIIVFPAGCQDNEYLGKVSRIDLEWELARDAGFKHPLERLLHQIRKDLDAQWILIDSRTGFSEVSGLLLSGFAHLHVLFGLQSKQSWSGLARVVAKVGEERLVRGLPQSDAFLVQTLLQDQPSRDRFEEEAEQVFFEHYYAGTDDDSPGLEANDSGESEAMDLLDAEGDDAPHKAEGIPYIPAFSQEVDLTDSVKLRALLSGEYRAMANRIARRTGKEERDGEN